MQGMQLQEVKDRKSVAQFHKMPFELYKNDSNWIPHIKQDIEKIFSPKENRLFNLGGKAIRWVLKDEAGKVIGRNAAFVNPKTANKNEQPTGGMGFFECIDNQDAANILFDAAKKWLQAEGMEAMDGPVNFGDRNQFWGLLIENFKDMSSYGLNYNLPYYQKLFENYGWQIYFNQYCFKRDMYLPAQPVFVRKYNQMMADSKTVLTLATGMSIEKIAHDFREVYNSGWAGHHGFKEMSEEGALRTVKSMKPILDKEIIIFAYYEDKPIAFYVNIPELNEIFRYVNGNLNLLGKLKFLYHKWRGTPKTMIGVVFGVSREFQGKGVEGALIKFGEDYIVTQNRYYETVLTWIGDFNPKMLHVAESLGSYKYRTLATYRYLFDRNKPFERCPIAE